MISHELKAQAKLAYQNWRSRNPDAPLLLNEEDFVKQVEDLQAHYNRGLILQKEFDDRIQDLLKNPSVAVGISQFQPPQKSTDALLRELEGLKKSGVLSDEQFEERKAELLYQRGAEEGQSLLSGAGAPAGDSPAARKARWAGYLKELLEAGILSHSEFAMAQQRLAL
ncbi:MAG: hypothetical protein RLZZ165_933 [Bacteroidota bacterium]|jgi:hypothetical protein